MRTRSLLALLDPPTECIASDSASEPIGAALVEDASSIHEAMRQADQDLGAARLDQAQARLNEALAQATALQRPALRGLVLLELGTVAARRSKPTEARQHYEEAYEEGNAGQDDGVAAEAALRAAQVEHDAHHDAAATEDWLRAAEAVLGRANPMPEVRSHYLQLRGLTEKDPSEAIRWFEQQRPLLELRGDEVSLAYLELNLGSRHEELDRLDTAIAMTEAAIPRLIAQLGEGHRMTARARINLGRYYRERGDTAKEIELYTAALPALEASGDREGLLALRVNISSPLAALDRHDEALQHLELALEDALSIWGADHLRTATVQGALGLLYDDLERYDDAERMTVRAMETRRQLLGPEDPWVGRMLVRLGNLARDRERFDDALAYFDQAVSATETSAGADSLDYALATYSRGITLRDLGRVPEGIAVIESALGLMSRHGRDPTQLARGTLALAKAHWKHGDKQRAREVAAEAAAIAEGQAGDVVADIAKWRDSH